MKRAWSKIRIPALVVLLLAGPAWSQDRSTNALPGRDERTDDRSADEDSDSGRDEFRMPHLRGWGVRFGVANDPDQVLAGIQLDMGSIMDRVYAEPSFEIGVGDDHTIFKATATLQYRIGPEKRVRPYVGGGITIGLEYFDPPDRGSDTDFELAFRAIGGTSWVLQSRRQFFLEGAIIFGDLHDFQVMAGWRF